MICICLYNKFCNKREHFTVSGQNSNSNRANGNGINVAANCITYIYNGKYIYVIAPMATVLSYIIGCQLFAPTVNGVLVMF